MYIKTVSSVIPEIFDKIYSMLPIFRVVFTPSTSTTADERKLRCQIFFSRTTFMPKFHRKSVTDTLVCPIVGLVAKNSTISRRQINSALVESTRNRKRSLDPTNLAENSRSMQIRTIVRYAVFASIETRSIYLKISIVNSRVL